VDIHYTACPYDCWDQCSLEVSVENGEIISIKPDSRQPVTGRFICNKGKHLLKQNRHPQRVLYPLKKEDGVLKRISWPEALEIMARRIDNSISQYGPLSLLHYYDGGYGGLLKNLESRFFSALGGCTVHRGSLCWAAGLAAQRYDFGDVLSHPHQDLINSRLVIIWGRNPANTQLHLLPYIKKARENGTKVILIDPLKTASAAIADQYVRVNPASDGVLALAMANVIIKKSMHDLDFINESSKGFEQYAALCSEFTPETAAEICGIKPEKIVELAEEYAQSKPASILIGIGMQRHSNGGNSVRAIDALAALTGNIGIAGGGASYANFRVNSLIDQVFLEGGDLNPVHRRYAKPEFASALGTLKDPPVKFLYISRSNPLVQVGDSNALRKAFKKVPFIVTAELFLTDTALASDLVLPVTHILENDDLFYNSMSHQYIVYSKQAIKPPGECRAEYRFIAELAGRMGVKGYPDLAEDELITRLIRPLTLKSGITLQALKESGPLLPEQGDSIPWSDRIFKTPGQKYCFYSSEAEENGSGGLPVYKNSREIGNARLIEEGYKYWFVTPHPRDSIHSSHRLPEEVSLPLAYISKALAAEEELEEGSVVFVETKRGKIKVKISITEAIPHCTVMVYEGWWHKSGAAVNSLTADYRTDMGDQAAYYDCLCRIVKAG